MNNCQLIGRLTADPTIAERKGNQGRSPGRWTLIGRCDPSTVDGLMTINTCKLNEADARNRTGDPFITRERKASAAVRLRRQKPCFYGVFGSFA